MSWVLCIFLLTSLLGISLSKDERSNEVSPPQPPFKLDANLRRALLRALEDLEVEEQSKVNQEKSSTKSKNEDASYERASAAALSIFASTTTSEVTTEEVTQKPIVVIQKSNGLQHKPVTILLKSKNPDPVNEAFLTSASSFNSPIKTETRSVSSGANANFVSITSKPKGNFVTRPPVTQRTEITSPAPTIATSTEESEAKVEDIQFFSAPLVAAFTVHHDERGLPKSVEPIYKQSGQTAISPKQVEAQQLRQQELLKTEHLKQQQLQLQINLQEKQKALEQHYYNLQQQQKQQDYLLLQQQVFHEQQLQFQRQRLLEEQARLHKTQAFIPLNQSPKNSGSISFEPSISLQQPNYLVNQQLPLRAANDFHQIPPYLQPQQSFTPFQNNYQNLVQSAPKRTRVFRQESGTGNFLNSNYNDNVVIQPSVSQTQSNRYFRNGQRFNQAPQITNHLNNLLYHSGISRGRQQEDLNLVSKVLSLNHLGGGSFFGGSNVSQQRIPAFRRADRIV